MSSFPLAILQKEFSRGIKIPKFLKFVGEAGESTVEYVARYQIECGGLANDEFLKRKYFPSSFEEKIRSMS